MLILETTIDVLTGQNDTYREIHDGVKEVSERVGQLVVTGLDVMANALHWLRCQPNR